MPCHLLFSRSVSASLFLLCISSDTTDHGEKQEVVLENSSEGRVHNHEGSSSPIRGVASRSKVEFVSSVDDGFRRAQPWSCGTSSTRPARIQGEREVLSSEALKVREQSRVQPVGERLNSILKFIQRSRTKIEKIQADLTREQVLLQQVRRPQASMDVEDPEEEVRRLIAQVAELQQERAARQEVEESKAKKARVVHPRWIWPGAAGSRNASDTMQNFVDAADSTLKEARSLRDQSMGMGPQLVLNDHMRHIDSRWGHRVNVVQSLAWQPMLRVRLTGA